VGGGVVGAALACQLAQTPSLAGQRILVVESFAPPPLPTALAPGRPVRELAYWLLFFSRGVTYIIPIHWFISFALVLFQLYVNL
jgi:glycine/D-amino acid oxidase-like deaminating enzyme